MTGRDRVPAPASRRRGVIIHRGGGRRHGRRGRCAGDVAALRDIGTVVFWVVVVAFFRHSAWVDDGAALGVMLVVYIFVIAGLTAPDALAVLRVGGCAGVARDGCVFRTVEMARVGRLGLGGWGC